MNFFSKKSNLIKSRFAVVAVAICLVNYFQSNIKHKSVSIVGVADANAYQSCLKAPGQSCAYYIPAIGLWHYTANAELID